MRPVEHRQRFRLVVLVVAFAVVLAADGITAAAGAAIPWSFRLPTSISARLRDR